MRCDGSREANGNRGAAQWLAPVWTSLSCPVARNYLRERHHEHENVSFPEPHFISMTFQRCTLMMLQRATLGVVVAGAIAGVARRAGALSRSGAFAALFVGTATVTGSWRWGALLLTYFTLSTVLSRFGRERKETLTSGVLAKGGARDAVQVMANGGVFAAGALLSALAMDTVAVTMSLAALGALSASAADTWATEIGTLYGGTPRSLLTMRRVPVGSSGGVSVAGLAAMVAGAAVIAAVAVSLGLTHDLHIITTAGVAGAVVDSLLGATLQERRWCAACGRSSEQPVHDCGSATTLVGGHEWMNNDMVNLMATFVGAAVAVLLAHV